jgi:competence protein ComEA
MWWKDYLYFSRPQRNGIRLLLLLILFAIVFPGIYRLSFPVRQPDFSEFEKDFPAFFRLLDGEQEPASVAPDEKPGRGEAPEGSGRVRPASERQEIEVNLTPAAFDPNKISVQEWEKMGIPAYVARSIGNYKSAGGVFRYREDVRRLHLMEESWYQILEPHILLPGRHDSAQAGSSPGMPDSGQGDTRQLPLPRKEGTEWHGSASPVSPVSINLADTAALMEIRGIGPVFSRRIVGYRDLLGGFYHPDQLLEVYGMDSSRWKQILPRLEFDTLLIRKIDLNEASFEDLLRHPYIDRNLANSLSGIRRQHGPLESTDGIRRSWLVTDSVFNRIKPYLKVKQRP